MKSLNYFVQIDGDTGVALKMHEIHLRAIRIAQNLLKLGCTQSDRIAIFAQNTHNLTPLAVASVFIGTPFAAQDAVMLDGKKLLSNNRITLFPQNILSSHRRLDSFNVFEISFSCR